MSSETKQRRDAEMALNFTDEEVATQMVATMTVLMLLTQVKGDKSAKAIEASSEEMIAKVSEMIGDVRRDERLKVEREQENARRGREVAAGVPLSEAATEAAVAAMPGPWEGTY